MGENKKGLICSDNLQGIARNVEAFIKDGCLEIEGQDLGSSVLGSGGEQKYFYSFDIVETKEFAEILIGDSLNLKASLVAFLITEKFRSNTE